MSPGKCCSSWTRPSPPPTATALPATGGRLDWMLPDYGRCPPTCRVRVSTQDALSCPMVSRLRKSLSPVPLLRLGLGSRRKNASHWNSRSSRRTPKRPRTRRWWRSWPRRCRCCSRSGTCIGPCSTSPSPVRWPGWIVNRLIPTSCTNSPCSSRMVGSLWRLGPRWWRSCRRRERAMRTTC